MKDQELKLQLLRHWKAVVDLSIREDNYGSNGFGYFASDRDYFSLILGIDFNKFYDSKENYEIGKKYKEELQEGLSFLEESAQWGFIGDTLTQILHNRITKVKFDKINDEFEKDLSKTIKKAYNVFIKLDKVATLEKEIKEKNEEIESLQRNLKSVLQVNEGKCKSFDNAEDAVNDLFDKKKLTTREEMLNCNHGLYKVYWRQAGISLASIGSLSSGYRWIAPINWTGDSSPTALLSDYTEEILKLEPINA